MANIDVTQTLASKFSTPSIALIDQLAIEALAKYTLGISSGTPPPTIAQVNTTMITALQLLKARVALPLQAIKTALYWQACVNNFNTGIYVATSTPSAILSNIGYLRNFTEDDLRSFILYCEGRELSVLT